MAIKGTRCLGSDELVYKKCLKPFDPRQRAPLIVGLTINYSRYKHQLTINKRWAPLQWTRFWKEFWNPTYKSKTPHKQIGKNTMYYSLSERNLKYDVIRCQQLNIMESANGCFLDDENVAPDRRVSNTTALTLFQCVVRLRDLQISFHFQK